ncbi:TetR/AcrR family transcriptional regulator [Streptomyces sp. MUM 203J]|uniref:TetR/AcrR family transcriptional regulator n=1 Tax=Streptomyces sp. MUM 203J TaxID=2791990 RepID=UPI001F04EECF|nr:TetR/AcrR family transcriptional regulator [Streptomyces sp. MUM 203J]MCH0540836.1 TetR/AcrR family transcriptional regulator [Streptomyces sp. MUM 203J]
MWEEADTDDRTSVSPPGGVRQERKRQTRRALLAAAREVLGRRGLSGLTTREVAAEAGVAAGTFFVHFPDVNSLVETLLDEHIEHAMADACGTLPPSADVVGRLVHVAGRMYDSYDREPELSRQYLAASLFPAGPGGVSAQRVAEFREWVAAELARAEKAGEIPPVDVELAFTAYFSLYFALLVRGLRGEIGRDGQVRMLDETLRRILGAGGRS